MPVVFIIVALAAWLYIKFASQARRIREIESDLRDERRTRADIVKWIEHECRVARAFHVERALKQRIDERLEIQRQLRLQRQQIRRV